MTDEWKKEFIKEFVNDHGTEWRPLRGLWVEQVISFISTLLDNQKEEERKRIISALEKVLEPKTTPQLITQIIEDVNSSLKEAL